MKKTGLLVLASSLLAFSVTSALAEVPQRTECIAPAKPGGGFDLTCKLIQVSMQETGQLTSPMRVPYMPGGVGAVAMIPNAPLWFSALDLGVAYLPMAHLGHKLARQKDLADARAQRAAQKKKDSAPLAEE